MKRTLKTDSKILKMMNESKKTKKNQIIEKNTFSLPKANQNFETLVQTFCYIENDVKENGKEVKIKHNSISISHKSEYETIKSSNQIKKNKYYFQYVETGNNFDLFMSKKVEPEIIQFMSGSTRLIALISEKTTLLSYLSNYILKTNLVLEKNQQSIYEIQSFKSDYNDDKKTLDEAYSFSAETFYEITKPNDSKAHLFLMNLTDPKYIQTLAELVNQIKKHLIDDNIDFKIPSFNKIFQICSKNSVLTIILLNKSVDEIVFELFSSKKKSYLEVNKADMKIKSSANINEPESKISSFESFILKRDDKNLQTDDQLIVESKSYMNPVFHSNNFSENEKIMFELLQQINLQEKENQCKIQNIHLIQNEIDSIKNHIDILKGKRKQIIEDINKVKSDIDSTEEENDFQIKKNNDLMVKLKEMILQTGNLKNKYSNFINDIHEKNDQYREKCRNFLFARDSDYQDQIKQSESKWKAEYLKRKNMFPENDESQMNAINMTHKNTNENYQFSKQFISNETK